MTRREVERHVEDESRDDLAQERDTVRHLDVGQTEPIGEVLVGGVGRLVDFIKVEFGAPQDGNELGALAVQEWGEGRRGREGRAGGTESIARVDERERVVRAGEPLPDPVDDEDELVRRADLLSPELNRLLRLVGKGTRRRRQGAFTIRRRAGLLRRYRCADDPVPDAGKQAGTGRLGSGLARAPLTGGAVRYVTPMRLLWARRARCRIFLGDWWRSLCRQCWFSRLGLTWLGRRRCRRLFGRFLCEVLSEGVPPCN